MDKEIKKAIDSRLERAYGPTETWERSQLEEVSALSVYHARDLRGLSLCPNVKILLLVGCEISSLSDIDGLDSLTSLVVEDSTLKSLEGVQRWDIFSLRVKRNLIEELTPLTELPSLQLVDVTGNPISSRSQENVIPKLTARGIDVMSSLERERAITLRLHAFGLPFSYYRTSAGCRLGRPGLVFSNEPESGHPFIEPDEMDAILSGPVKSVHESVHGLFARKDLMWPANER
ncbi:hypothetical protein ACH4LE_23755 [Streptomyces sp. NPDC017413]|uniref:hypothetical protein n=1 Tax=Streptomyces sp. NPDC017413 TaxID=3364994 RepID=UPI0037A1E788